MTKLALLLDLHPDIYDPDRPVTRVVIGPFENQAQIEAELARTRVGAEPYRIAGIVEVPSGDPDGILSDASFPLTTTAIFTVTTLKTRKPKTEQERQRADGKDVLIESTRTPGFYPTLDLAKRCVEENWGHISETIYDHAVVEEVAYGLYPATLSSHWYQWHQASEAFLPCEKPYWMAKTYGSFAIG